LINYVIRDNYFSLSRDGILLIEQVPGKPALCLGRGDPAIDAYRGNFFIEDHIEQAVPLDRIQVFENRVSDSGEAWDLRFQDSSGNIELRGYAAEEQGRLTLTFSPFPAGFNRLILRIRGAETEHIYGCGEQFSYLDLKGHHFPLWVQEQGVGRNKKTEITKIADARDRAGGDYFTTFYPQPAYVSTRGYFLHAETYGYADFDFSDAEDHTLTFWEIPESITVGGGPSPLETVQDISAFLGRQGPLPGWVYDGVILGIQGGTEVCRSKLKIARGAGIPVAGIWAQDWQGEKYTSFGKRLRWNWQWDPELYPGLDEYIRELRDEGIRFLGYINPNILEGTPLYQEAKALNHLVLNEAGSVLLVDFGEFYAGMVDFTSEAARTWYKGIIRKNLIDFGLSGWMADFGEYLPVESALKSGMPAMTAHNAWPGFWARVNREAAAESAKPEDLLFFMRAGNARSLSQCPMMWAGDQNVDWSEDDGLPSALTGALSLAMSGHGLHHSDIGGYTTLYGLHRTKELFLRWAEFAAFTPLMRTHEGNRPGDNWQFDSDQETLRVLARLVKLHTLLKPYLQDAAARNAGEGIPVMAPVFLYYPEDPFFTCKDQYMLGPDLLIAPVLKEGAISRNVRFPGGRWRHLFTGQFYTSGDHEVTAPLGEPPVFYRDDSAYIPLFTGIQQNMKTTGR
jgi:alpha-glucosidase